MQEKPKPFLADIIETIADAVGSKDFKSRKSSSKKKSHNIMHKGPLGGVFYIKHGRKVYVTRK
jgi:hypothetical protein